MKEIKWMLFVLYIVAYTSLIWATIIFKGIPIGPNNAWVGMIFSIGLTVFNICLIVNYLRKNWRQDDREHICK